MSQIRDLVDGKVVEEMEKAVLSTPQTPTEPPPGFMDEMAVAQQMGLEKQSEISQYKDDIQTIIKWARLEGYENPTELKWIIRQLQDRLGTPPLTEKWITRVSRFAYLKLQESKIQEEADSLLR